MYSLPIPSILYDLTRSMTVQLPCHQQPFMLTLHHFISSWDVVLFMFDMSVHTVWFRQWDCHEGLLSCNLPNTHSLAPAQDWVLDCAS